MVDVRRQRNNDTLDITKIDGPLPAAPGATILLKANYENKKQVRKQRGKTKNTCLKETKSTTLGPSQFTIMHIVNLGSCHTNNWCQILSKTYNSQARYHATDRKNMPKQVMFKQISSRVYSPSQWKTRAKMSVYLYRLYSVHPIQWSSKLNTWVATQLADLFAMGIYVQYLKI